MANKTIYQLSPASIFAGTELFALWQNNATVNAPLVQISPVSAIAANYGVSPLNPDNGSALSAFFSALVAGNVDGYLPAGALPVKTPIVVTGSVSGSGQSINVYGATAQQQSSSSPGSASGTQIYWNASAPTTSPLLAFIGIGKLVMRNVGLFGLKNTGHVLYVDQGSGNAPYGYELYGCVMEGPGAGYACEYLDGTINTARFMHKSCVYLADLTTGYTTPTTCNGFQSANQNALNHTFESCVFQQCNYGAACYKGSATFYRCEFVLNSGADIYHDGGNATGISVIDCYADFGKQFMYAAYNSNSGQLLKIDGGQYNCSPLTYWAYAMAAFQTGGPDPGACPTGNVSQAMVLFNRSGMLRLRDAQFTDPWNGNYPSYLTGAAGWPGGGVQGNVTSNVISAPADWLRSGAVACNGNPFGFQRTPGFDAAGNPVTWLTS